MKQVQFTSLAVQGFKCFVQDQVLKFDSDPGIYLLSGSNEVDPQLGGNGVGKSTLWDALVWVLFGKTLRGVRGKHVTSWLGHDMTSVQLTFSVGNHQHVLTRTANPNTLTLATNQADPEQVDQLKVEDLVGYGFEGFTQCVVVGQFNTYFVDLPPLQRVRLFEHLLRLQVWDKLSTNARKSAVDLLHLVDGDLRTKCDKLCGSIDAKRAQYKAMKQEQRMDKLAARNRKVELTKIYNQHNQLQQQSVERAAVASGKVDALLAKHSKASKQYEKLAPMAQRANVLVGTTQAGIKTCKVDIATQKRVMATTKDKRNQPCPECGRKLTEKSVDVLLDTQRTHLDWSRGELGKLRAKLVDAKGAAIAAQQRVDEASTEQHRLLEAKSKQVERKLKHDAAANRHQWECQQATDALGTLDSTLRSTKQALVKLVASAKRDKKELAGYEAERGKLAAEAEQYQFWSTKFKELRLWLISGAVKELELLANSNLDRLGMKGWKLEFHIEQQTKSGTVTRGFTIAVQPPGTDEAKPWECWSGGETQRLRIATSAALATMVRNRVGTGCNLEVWDEPTAHLSPAGIDMLLQFFSERVDLDKRQVWVVDHRNLDHGNFSHHVHVTKSKLGSTIARLD